MSYFIYMKKTHNRKKKVISIYTDKGIKASHKTPLVESGRVERFVVVENFLRYYTPA